MLETSKTLLLAAAVLTLAQPLRGQVFFNRDDMAVVHGWVEGKMPEQDLTGQQTYKNAVWRKKMLIQFPRADRNGDGALTESEALRYHMAQPPVKTPQGKELHFLPKDVSRWTARVPMRDGATLPTEIYLPPGEGPWPVVLLRTSRGRVDSALDTGNEMLRNGYAFVGQDLTPAGDFVDADELGKPTGRQALTREQRAAMNARRSRRNAGEDGYDTVEWIAKQGWSTGKIAITGYSEACSTSKATVAQRPPHLAAAVTAIGTLSRRGSTIRSGARLSWNGQMPERPEKWSPPTGGATDALSLFGTGALVKAAPKVDIYLVDRTGWFDFATQGAIDEWVALKGNGKSILVMGIGGHGALSKEARLPPAYGDCDILFRQTDQFAWLTGGINESNTRSRMYYFLMGDATDPNAPGNVWKVTDTWPIPHTLRNWHLTGEGKLSADKAATGTGSLSYTHDPNDPVQTVLGARMPARYHGPLDQSHLKGRDDILRFDSEPLAEPLEITGQPVVELFVSTDAPDTMFTVTLVDIYPDGYEWPIRDAALMLRHREGPGNAQPARKGEVYKLTMEMTSTALIINKGHRIGVRVSSSSFPAWEIHPNTWDAIDSYGNARVARNTVHLSAEHPSRVTLPVIASGVSQNYDPKLHSR